MFCVTVHETQIQVQCATTKAKLAVIPLNYNIINKKDPSGNYLSNNSIIFNQRRSLDLSEVYNDAKKRYFCIRIAHNMTLDILTTRYINCLSLLN